MSLEHDTHLRLSNINNTYLVEKVAGGKKGIFRLYKRLEAVIKPKLHIIRKYLSQL